MRIVMDHPLFEKAKPVFLQIESHQYEAYFVGGCVRDLLLRRPIHDIDIATSAFPAEIQKIFPKTFDVGIEHGTVVVIYQGDQYEITTFRTEGKYSDYRRPDQVNFVRNLQEDTLRRDFTINALAINSQGQLFDYHGGLEDLNQHIIRCVGDPYQRFSEDALRMMRAIRFASQLDFRIESQTFNAIIELSANLKYIAIERIRIEFMKFLTGEYFLQHYHLVHLSQLSNYLPGFENQQKTEKIIEYLAEDLSQLQDESLRSNDYLVWARLIYYMKLSENQQRNFLRQWTHSNDFIQKVIEINKIITNVQENRIDRWFLHQCQMENIILAQNYINETQNIKINIIEEKLSIPITSKKDIQVNGKDIMNLLKLRQGGPIVGKLLDQVEEAIVFGKLPNQRQVLLDYLCNKLE